MNFLATFFNLQFLFHLYVIMCMIDYSRHNRLISQFFCNSSFLIKINGKEVKYKFLDEKLDFFLQIFVIHLLINKK